MEHTCNCPYCKLEATNKKLLEALKNWFDCADDHEHSCRCGREKAKQAISSAEGKEQS